MTPGATARRPWTLALALGVGAPVALVLLPRQRIVGGDGAALLGFDPALAHLVFAALAFACVAWYAWRGAAAPLAPADPPPRPARAPWWEPVAVAGLVLLAYFPPFLARYGPYHEDNYFFTSLFRYMVGQRPYVDFEFIYGPLLVFPIGWWFERFGFSLQAYYWFLALVEAATFALLAVGLGRLVPDRRARWLALVALGLLLVNDNLGLSYLALRKLLPALVLLAWATLPRSARGALIASALVGVQLVLSLEFAAAAVAAIGATAAVEALAVRRLAPLGRAAAVLAGGFVAGAVLAFAMMGADAPEWIRATARIITLRSGGEAAFPFQLSVNAVAVFSLIFLACAAVGAGLRRARGTPFASGDRFLVAALAYGVVALKSGLARSDMYHLVPPIIALVAAALVPLPRAAVPPLVGGRRWAQIAVLVVCLTYGPGMVGAGRFWLRGLVLGARDVASGIPPSGVEPERSRGPRLGAERTEQKPGWIELADYLAHPSRVDRPLLFYERTWGTDKMIGVPKPREVYALDDYLVSDAAGLELRAYLERRPDALVLIERAAWAYLLDQSTEPVEGSMFWLGRVRSWPFRFLERWSSSHFGTAPLDEQVRKRHRWARTVGAHVLAHYSPAAEFGNWIVLSRPVEGE